MDRARIRAFALVASGLILLLSDPVHGSTAAPSRPQKSTSHEGWWEQWIVPNQLKFLYVPREFVAGAGPAYVKIHDLTNGALAVDLVRSNFQQPDAGLMKQHIAPEWYGFYVTIPRDVRTGDYAYVVELACRRASGVCPTGVFYVPVKNDDDQILEVRPRTGQFHIPVVAESSQFQVELRARRPIQNVRLMPNPNHLAVGIRSFELGEPGRGGAADFVIKQTIDEIGSGQSFHGWVKVNRASGMAQAWNYLVSDWRGSIPELALTFAYSDPYDREWRLESAPIGFAYQLPPWGLLLYYAAFLGLATMAGTVGRLAAGAAVGKLRTEARAWGYSLLLAGVLCVLGLVLRAKVEPIGLFQLELTNVRGILVTGVVAGLMPEVIRGRLQTLLPGRQAAGRSATARGRTSVRRTEGRVSPHRRKTGADDGSRRGPQQHPPLVESPGFAG